MSKIVPLLEPLSPTDSWLAVSPSPSVLAGAGGSGFTGLPFLSRTTFSAGSISFCATNLFQFLSVSLRPFFRSHSAYSGYSVSLSAGADSASGPVTRIVGLLSSAAFSAIARSCSSAASRASRSARSRSAASSALRWRFSARILSLFSRRASLLNSPKASCVASYTRSALRCGSSSSFASSIFPRTESRMTPAAVSSAPMAFISASSAADCCSSGVRRMTSLYAL